MPGRLPASITALIDARGTDARQAGRSRRVVGIQAAQVIALPAALEVPDQEVRHGPMKGSKREIGPQRERAVVIGERFREPPCFLMHRAAKIVQDRVVVAQAHCRSEAFQRPHGIVQLLVGAPEQELRLIGIVAADRGFRRERARSIVIVRLQQRIETLPERGRGQGFGLPCARRDRRAPRLPQ